MRRYSVEELCETAEEYFRRVPDPTPLMTKPFAFLHETPEMLQNLGLLFSGLQLGKSMTVLDFGAGTCWLSRFLAQLNCQVICCDTSRTALAIGKRLFDEHPPSGSAVVPPQFLWFDGHRIDLPDGSVDRIVCFDAFHHVPNGGQVVSELGRILKRGGIAGFSEPGRRHSQSPASQYEMRNHKVLENDIDLNVIFADAQRAGFTDLRAKVLTDMEISLDDYNVFFGDADTTALKAELWNQTHNTLFNRSIFFLHKGQPSRDSRSHVGLGHTITIDAPLFEVPRGQPLRLSVTVTNTGTAVWLATNTEIHGIVRLGSHLYDETGKLLDVDYSRHGLPGDVPPGETISLLIEVPLPTVATCQMAFDLVAEGVTWFENVGSTPKYVTVRMV
jgi:SAM-dependent methyltransferase